VSARALALLALLAPLAPLAGCAPSLLGAGARAAAAEGLARRGEALLAPADAPGAPGGDPVGLARALYDADPALAHRLRGALRVEDLRGAGVRRGGRPQVGDLLVFRPLPETLEVAVVIAARGARLRAVGLLRGAPREVVVDLDAPAVRRDGAEVRNTYIRKAHPSPAAGADAAECPCLAGELLVDVRALF